MTRIYITTEQAAAYLGLRPGTLEDWRLKRQGPPWVQVTHGWVRYDLQVLEGWLESQTVQEAPGMGRAR